MIFLILMAMFFLIIKAEKDMVARGIPTTPSANHVVRITMATVVVLGSRTVAMRAIENNNLTKIFHQINRLLHDRSDVSYATFLATQHNNVHG